MLQKIGLVFKVDPDTCEEDISCGSEPHKLAQKISLGKAESVAGKYKDAVVIGADTFVVLDGMIMGKPQDAVEARRMLETLSGRSHLVISGFTIIDTASGKVISQSVETRVYFKEIAPEEIDSYVKSGEPAGKAGAYGIQGLGSLFVERIEGDYFNVIGLPLFALTEAFKEFGIRVI